jgi:glycosyltransferase involved in cell wall biosynthesis
MTRDAGGATERTPRISIILPVFNGGRHLEKTIRCLLAQTFDDFELLILDDGSTDDSPNIARSFGDRRIQVRTQSRTGATEALRRLLAWSRGEFVARADADDLYAPERLERQVELLHGDRDIGVVGAQCELIAEDNQPAGRRWFPCRDGEIRRMLRLGSPLPHPVAMFRRDLARNAGGYAAEFRYAQDYDLWTRLAARTRFANLPEVLLRYRVHAQAITTTHRQEQVDAHRGIRRAWWATLPAEEKAESRWADELRETIEGERQAFGDHFDAERLTTELFRRRVSEANVAFGARRDDVGLRCLAELARLTGERSFALARLAAQAVGFRRLWQAARLMKRREFVAQWRDNPLAEW